VINLVLCGGAGKRLWPLSSSGTPKQFVRLGTEPSLYMEAVRRNSSLCDKIIISTDQKYADAAVSQIFSAELPVEYILEPSSKNTAPPIAFACMLYPGEIMLAAPADHKISDTDSYEKAVAEAKKFAEKGYIAVFGVEADSPEEEFGYISAAGEDVTAFYEKPDKNQAEEYIRQGFMFNSGILCFNTDVMLKELWKYMPDQMYIAKTVLENVRSGKTTHRLCGRFMGEMRNISIDRAVLEKSDKLKCVRGLKGWSDMGSYTAIYRHSRKDKNGNVGLNIGDSYGCADFAECTDSMVISKDADVTVCGLSDVLVVESNGKILVAKKGADIRDALKKLEGR